MGRRHPLLRDYVDGALACWLAFVCCHDRIAWLLMTVRKFTGLRWSDCKCTVAGALPV